MRDSFRFHFLILQTPLVYICRRLLVFGTIIKWKFMSIKMININRLFLKKTPYLMKYPFSVLSVFQQKYIFISLFRPFCKSLSVDHYFIESLERQVSPSVSPLHLLSSPPSLRSAPRVSDRLHFCPEPKPCTIFYTARILGVSRSSCLPPQSC